jgi:hypothetical protein
VAAVKLQKGGCVFPSERSRNGRGARLLVRGVAAIGSPPFHTPKASRGVRPPSSGHSLIAILIYILPTRRYASDTNAILSYAAFALDNSTLRVGKTQVPPVPAGGRTLSAEQANTECWGGRKGNPELFPNSCLLTSIHRAVRAASRRIDRAVRLAGNVTPSVRSSTQRPLPLQGPRTLRDTAANQRIRRPARPVYSHGMVSWTCQNRSAGAGWDG